MLDKADCIGVLQYKGRDANPLILMKMCNLLDAWGHGRARLSFRTLFAQKCLS